MTEVFGSQQGDAWFRARIGRPTGSRLVDVCNYLTRASGGKKAGESSAKRDNYKLELIAERLTGWAGEHFVTPEMQWGMDNEENAVLCYESVMRVMAEPCGFFLHPDMPFTGASPDRLIGEDGLLEVKCPATTTHLQYVIDGVVPEKYYPQIIWELACTGRQWADFVSYDPRIQDDKLKFFYRRLERESLTWIIDDFSEGKPKEVVLTGQAVIDYFTSEIVKFEAEIQAFMTEHGCTPQAPYPVDMVEEAEGGRIGTADEERAAFEAMFADEIAP